VKGSIFWDITPYIPLKFTRRFGRKCFHFQDRRISQGRNQREVGSKLSLTLKMEATFFSETSVNFQRNTWCYISEDRTLREITVVYKVFGEDENRKDLVKDIVHVCGRVSHFIHII
jgi:hypothetical protein